MSFSSRLLRREAPAAPQRRSFDAALPAARRGFQHFGSTAPETVAAALPLRSRARHAAANNAWAANGVSAIVGESIGAGIEPTSDATAVWNAFAQQADVEGRTDLRGLLADMVRACVVDGEAFGLIEEGAAGIQLRLLPAEMIDESRTADLPGGGFIAAGIEFDARGRRTAYHVFPNRPTDLFPTSRETIRVPAEDMLHLMRPIGPGQIRGTSCLAPILLTLNELDQLQDALLVGAKIAAMHAGFVIDLNATGDSSAFDGSAEISLEPDTVRRLGPGEDIRFNSPGEAKDSIPFAKLTLEQIAAGLGVPTHLLTGDLSGANYSSMRAGLLPFRQKIEQFQYHRIVPQVLDPLWRRVMSHAYLAGQIDSPVQPVEWLMPRPLQVDPLKDTQALIAQMGAGLTSRTAAIASLGWDSATLDAEIAADKAREQSLGLSFTQEQKA